MAQGAKGRGSFVWVLLGLAALGFCVSKNDEPKSPSVSPPQATQTAPTAIEQATTVSPTQPAITPPALETWRVSGNRVRLREGPSTSSKTLGTYDKGTTLEVIGSSGEWRNVRVVSTGQTGWMYGRYLSNATQQQAQPVQEQLKKKEKKTTISDAAIAKLLIKQSLASYPGNCPCPYNYDRGGRRCGGRSAYSRPGGYSPYCYAADVPKAVIEAYRNSLEASAN